MLFRSMAGSGRTHVVAFTRFSREGDLVQPLIVHCGVAADREQLLVDELADLGHAREVVRGGLVELDHQDELGRLLALVEVDLVRLLAQEVGIAIADERPVGEVHACGASAKALDAEELKGAHRGKEHRAG